MPAPAGRRESAPQNEEAPVARGATGAPQLTQGLGYAFFRRAFLLLRVVFLLLAAFFRRAFLRVPFLRVPFLRVAFFATFFRRRLAIFSSPPFSLLTANRLVVSTRLGIRPRAWVTAVPEPRLTLLSVNPL